MSSVFVDFHVLQSVPAANLNRDDLGSPKTVRYGDAQRIRVSSQSWKRAMRLDIEAELGEPAARTRLLPSTVSTALQEKEWPKDLADFAGSQIVASAGKKGLKVEKGGHTSVLLFLPEAGVEELVTLCAEHRAALEAGLGKKKPGQLLPPEEVAEVLRRRTATINLLGRMVAEIPGAKVDGAAQVAHAFTTHAAEPQRDYFTAVDDWLGEEDTGSGHLNTAEFSAGVFYRFASVNLSDLLKNLGGDHKAARDLLTAFADHFLMSLPQAKKNSTAPHTIPDLAYFAVRTGRPVSLAAAFEKPVQAGRDGGFGRESREALAAYAEQVERLTGGRHRPFHGQAGVDDEEHKGLGTRHTSYSALTDKTVETAFVALEENSEGDETKERSR